ncbi:hypothetical protein [Actinoplanes teichomyceticus]|uniref:Uncharacterized protein n=1 Tax=Actinoplanes teichomyceticus TaxID=1867 RepID=A0A561WB24_ACTTI|nr:hypothetical protein [Actinoplanes teichomyceticus]TWG21045.1 hypothetical protein FHX34_103574 [Actinoplanes teichomyceticus]GIF14865.1 hypothetical protein Ate01nite_48970 [Actinoplanes teichomyceticus]
MLGWFADVTPGTIQFGYEITSSSGGLDFTTKLFRLGELTPEQVRDGCAPVPYLSAP